MTLTRTVSTLAQDAAKATSELASDLGSQAAGLGAKAGTKAAEFGSEAASTVAAAASNLASAIAQRVPAAPPKRRTMPWRLIVLITVIVAGVAVVLKGRRKPSSPATDFTATRPVVRPEATIAKADVSTNGAANEAGQVAEH